MSLQNQNSPDPIIQNDERFDGFPGVLDEIINLLVSMDDEFISHRDKLLHVRERLSQGRIHLAVLGQFKRGKSSLLNALLGSDLLPTSVIPVTSIPTYIRYDPKPGVRVIFTDGRPDEINITDSVEELCVFLKRYVSEEGNPENRLSVSEVVLNHNAPLLEHGIVLIDTPGIGSTHLHNTEATLNFLPQCDAALFLVSADPPVTEVEIEFLVQVRKKIEKIFFVLNKIDYLSETERNEVASFILRVLRKNALVTEDVELIPLSARWALDAARLNDPVTKERSGINLLLHHLTDFSKRDKHAVLTAALSRKTADIVNDVEMQIGLALKAYKMPVEELGEKLSLFDGKIREAEQQKVLTADILAGERKRLLLLLEEQSESLREKSRLHLESILTDFFSKGGTIRENDVREAFSEAIPVFFEHELGELSRFFDRRVAEIIAHHRSRADSIIDSVRKSASDIFDIRYRAQMNTEGIEFVREPYWVLHQWKSSLVPVPDELIDRLLPKKMRDRRIRKRLEKQIGALVLNNVENLRWSTLQNLDVTFRKFISDIEERFVDIIGVTRDAIGAALEKRRNYSELIAGEVSRLEKFASKLYYIKKRMGDI